MYRPVATWYSTEDILLTMTPLVALELRTSKARRSNGCCWALICGNNPTRSSDQRIKDQKENSSEVRDEVQVKSPWVILSQRALCDWGEAASSLSNRDRGLMLLVGSNCLAMCSTWRIINGDSVSYHDVAGEKSLSSLHMEWRSWCTWPR